MPVVINQRDLGSKKADEKKPQNRTQPVTRGGVLSDVKIVIAIVAAAVLLVGGLVGWSQGWFGGSADVPANAASRPLGSAAAPMGGSDADNPMGHKRNRSIGE